MAELQTNVRYMDAGQEDKWTVGRTLRFTGYSPDEPSYPECMHLVPGDMVVVLASNACGMGIDVRRVRDGYLTMVWPEEVEEKFTCCSPKGIAIACSESIIGRERRHPTCTRHIH